MDLVLKESNGAGALTMHDITVHSSIALVPHIQQVTKDWQKKSGSELIRVGLNHQAHKKVLKYRNHVPVTFVPIVLALQAMAQDYPQLGPPTEAYFVCTRKEKSDKLPLDLGEH
ncbi:hypothetical protein WALSEDRAFT_65647 [Wallemia mellicola CBS 633.66]|uniref:Uncharacterized protein n=1 Tax=Wallemia mellicola (strain ATCC MYA-4683 / CBS 633.66) TaxID=671144 RepID=I4Y7X2_WALMC|nr:hypothetical protein WALSEDRAFT_65647 [Wallemia mellicola CBS 633.66]EIM20064.1 hypothetical protein WALSEDRAFT_65647 [Wallemia mellicola CBS 633.66]|eukprot:XP_006959785.1 hypothetical protein WALSEDRAFT_65647 [Wallemia mellicola CBS 633.66]